MADRKTPTTIDEYIAGFPPRVQTVLKKIRATVAAAAPGAREVISYRMPAFAQQGILLYFAGFKHHIGVYPPVAGDARLEKALLPYRGPKGNLKFPLDRPVPYDLIKRIATLRVKQNLARAAAKRQRRT
jgi:uncharacterized protein YdhG (YjbR/CyaY superfamily)